MGRFAVPAYIYTPTKVKLMEAEEMNIQPRNINGGEASTMNLPIRLAVCALQNCRMCGVELWNFNGDSVDCWQLTDSLLAGVGDDLLCLNMENIQRRWQLCCA